MNFSVIYAICPLVATKHFRGQTRNSVGQLTYASDHYFHLGHVQSLALQIPCQVFGVSQTLSMLILSLYGNDFLCSIFPHQKYRTLLRNVNRRIRIWDSRSTGLATRRQVPFMTEMITTSRPHALGCSMNLSTFIANAFRLLTSQ